MGGRIPRSLRKKNPEAMRVREEEESENMVSERKSSPLQSRLNLSRLPLDLAGRKLIDVLLRGVLELFEEV